MVAYVNTKLTGQAVSALVHALRLVRSVKADATRYRSVAHY